VVTLASSLYNAFKNALSYVWGILKNLAILFARTLHVLTSLNWKGLWQFLKRWWDWYRRWVARIQQILFGPFERIRQIILQIYAQFFAPLLRFIDAFRKLLLILAIFDRKLAAKLDRRLLDLEAYLLTPITFALERLNALSSYMRAIITTLGLLDRPLLLESIRRDAGIILHVLLNPLDRPTPSGPAATPRRDTGVVVRDVAQYANTESGYYAPGVQFALERLAQYQREIGR
jgi:hypothetical protein